MVKNLVLILFLLNSSFLFSQNEYQKSVDSLQLIITKEKVGSNKIKHYVALCDLYAQYDKTKYNTCNERLLSILQKTKSTKEYCFYYKNKARICNENNKNTQAIIYAAKANALYYKNRDWDNYILYCGWYAYYLYSNDQTEKAKAVLDKALSKAINTKSKYIASVYYEFCKLYTHISDYTTALKYAKKALALEKKTANKARIYIIVGTIYNALGNFKSALEYNELGIKYSRNPFFLTNNKLDRAEILYNMQRYQEALTIGLHCKEFYKENNYKGHYYDCVALITDCYFQLKKYHLANVYIDKALNSGLERRIIEIEFQTRKAKICLALNDTKTSKKYIDNALSLLIDNDYFEQRIETYNIKAKLEETLGNYKMALYYTNKVVAIKETNTTNFNKNKIHQLEVDLDVTEKNNSIKNLKITQLQKQAQINKKNKYLIYFFCALLVCVFGLLLFLYALNIIKIKNSIIGSTILKLEEESNKTQKSLTEKETLLKEIHHRVKNNMQLVISLLKIQARDAKQLSIESFIEISENRIRSMALIHEYLYESENINYVNFEEYIKRLSSSLLSSFSGQSDIKLETEIENAHFDIETSIPLGLIINELVINAFKHAFVGKEEGTIKIQLFKKEGLHQLIISDNGVGIGSNPGNGTSIGLKIVKSLVFQIGGVLQIKRDLGTHFSIQFNNNNHTNEQ